MKKKILTNTYLREATKYQIKLFLDEEDLFISVKKLIHVTEPFVIKHNTIAMNDGYYIIEILPKNEHYALRVFLDDKKNVIEYYFDIIKDSGIDEKYKVPYFNDLYLDITIFAPTGEINILDEKELKKALKNNDITKEDYELVLETKNQLLSEIESGTNALLNMDLQKYLDHF